MFYTIPRQHPFYVPAAHQHPCVKEFVVAFHPVHTKDPDKKDQDENGSSTTSPSSKVDATNAGSATANCPKTCGQAKSSLSCCRQQQPRVEHVFVQKSPIHYHEETPKAAKMSLDVTGFSLDNLSIEVEDYVVSISGKRTNKLGDIFSIQRRFRLDKTTADQDSVTATLEDGVLEIIVEKKAMTGPRKISIQSSSPASIVSKSDENTVTPSPSQATPIADEKKAHAEEQTEESGQIVNVETVQENEQVESDEQTDVPTNVSDTSKINSDHDTWEEVSN